LGKKLDGGRKRGEEKERKGRGLSSGRQIPTTCGREERTYLLKKEDDLQDYGGKKENEKEKKTDRLGKAQHGADRL